MICIPVTATSKQEALRNIERSCLIADAIELRMDLIADGKLAELICTARRISGAVKIIVTWRKREEAAQAGESSYAEVETKDQIDKKMAVLKQAVELNADYIDIELSCGSAAIEELKSYCRNSESRTKIIISYHNFKLTPSLVSLKKMFHQCRAYHPDVVKIVTYARKPADNLNILSLIPYAHKYSQEIIALCMGSAGRISRMMAPSLGNHLDFATLLQGVQSAPGQLTALEMKQIAKIEKCDAAGGKQLASSPANNQSGNYILLGNPVGQSLSPLMHNTALTDLGLPVHYNAFCVYDLAAAVQAIRGMDIRGASITVPFKSAVMEYLDDISADALGIGAVNTIINTNGRLTGANTDWLGLMIPLREALTVKGKKFVIIGAGGTARAAAYGIIKEGGYPVIVNRTEEKGKLLSNMFDCPFYLMSEIGKIEADCLINTTPVGMYPNADKSPMDASFLAGYKYVMDVIYNPLETKLLQDARLAGCRVLPGLDMFVHQGAEQIKLWTGREPNRELMKESVKARLLQSE